MEIIDVGFELELKIYPHSSVSICDHLRSSVRPAMGGTRPRPPHEGDGWFDFN